MREKIQSITEGTFLPISLVISLVGGVFWITQMYARGEATAIAVQQMADKFQSIDRRLSRIEGFMEKQASSEDE